MISTVFYSFLIYALETVAHFEQNAAVSGDLKRVFRINADPARVSSETRNSFCVFKCGFFDGSFQEISYIFAVVLYWYATFPPLPPSQC